METKKAQRKQELKTGRQYYEALLDLCIRGGQSTQLPYLSESTDTTGQILFCYK